MKDTIGYIYNKKIYKNYLINKQVKVESISFNDIPQTVDVKTGILDSGTACLVLSQSILFQLHLIYIYIYIYTKKIYIKHTMIIMFQNTVKNY